MKKNTSCYQPVIFCLLLTLVFITSSCEDNNYEKDTASEETKTTIISPAVLPRGKPAIDMNTGVAATTTKVEALKGNKYDSSNSISSIPEDSRTDILKKKFSRLLVFHADDTMEVNKPTLATLILSRNENIADLKLEVLEESNAKDKNIHVDTAMDFGSKMKARLIAFGSNNEISFTIEALGEDIQSFRNNRKKILWQWKITPLKPGEQELKLSIQVIEKDGESVSLPAKNIPVVIFAKPEKFWTKAGNFVSKNYELVFGTILIPILIAWFTTRMKNKSAKNTA